VPLSVCVSLSVSKFLSQYVCLSLCVCFYLSVFVSLMGQMSEGEESLGLCEHGSVCVQRRGAALRGLWRIPHFLGGVILLFPSSQGGTTA